jgi:hypothetical protein
VLETIQEYQLQDEIQVVHQFLIRLAGCVRMGSCDADVAAAQQGPALWIRSETASLCLEPCTECLIAA